MDGFCKFCQRKFDKKYEAQVFCSLVCSNRYNLNNKNQVRVPCQKSVGLAELFGILLGDGSVTKYFSKIYLNRRADRDYVPFVKKLAQKIFKGASVTCRTRPGNGTAEIQISARAACDYLKSIGFDAKKRTIPSWIAQNQAYTKATIRGLFDTEGSVGIKYFRGKNGNYVYKQLAVTNKNQGILNFISKNLLALGFKPTMNSNKNIYISNLRDIGRFVREIGLHNPKLINKIAIRDYGSFKIRSGRGAQKWKRGRVAECAALEMR